MNRDPTLEDALPRELAERLFSQLCQEHEREILRCGDAPTRRMPPTSDGPA